MNAHYQKTYGITIEEYEAILKKQGGVCAACSEFNVASNKTRMPLDHCHVTGKIRGILCNRCNRGLGLLGEDINRLSGLIRYLKEYS